MIIFERRFFRYQVRKHTPNPIQDIDKWNGLTCIDHGPVKADDWADSSEPEDDEGDV